MQRPHARPVSFLLAAALTLVSGPGRASAEEQVSAAASSASEKELLSAFKEAFASPGAEARAAAVTTLGDASRRLPDKGAGKRVAQALVKGLEDAELEVCQAAVFQLGSGRDVDPVIDALEAFLREHYRQLESRVGRTDTESSDYVSRATVVFENACYVLANYRDDRSAAILVALLGGLRGDTKKSDLGSRLVGALATSALDLGTLAAAETAVEQTMTFSGAAQVGGARKLHDALEAFGTKTGMTPPPWSESYTEHWHAWLEANRNKLPKKLGKLTAPPTSEASHPLNGLPGKSG